VGTTTPVVKDLSEMTEDELLALPRSAFSDKEWDRLDEDIQARIVEGDPDSQARIDRMVDEFVKRHKWTTEFQDHMRDSIQEDIDQQISQLSEPPSTEQTATLYERFQAEGYSDLQIEKALLEAFQDNNNYEYTWDTDQYGSTFFKGSYSDSFYMERTDLDDLLDGMYENEIEEALEQINQKTYLSLDRKDLRKKHDLDISEYSDFYGDADPDWDKIEEAVQDLLADEDPEKPEEEVSTDPEERVLYRWRDGFYVLNLLASELPAEGKAMGMCVGRSDMGYIKAVKSGRTQIWSLRRPSGKPLFTFEVKAVAPGSKKPQLAIVQIKGKANRLPGWDLGQEGRGAFKKDEVDRVMEFLLEFKDAKLSLPYEIRDLEPAIEYVHGSPTRTNPTSDKVHCGFCCPAD
jgi:hypothetical protein